MDFIGVVEKVEKFIFNSSKSWSSIIIKSVIVIILLVLTDLSTGFSYNLNVGGRLNQLEKTSKLKKENANDSVFLNKIKEIEDFTLSKKHYSEFLFFESLLGQNIKQYNTKTKSINPDKSIRSVFWMIISSNYSIVIILPFIIFLPIYDKNSRSTIGLGGWLTVLVMFGIILVLFTSVTYKIPLINNTPIWNYIINSLLHTIFIIVTYKIASVKK